MDIIGEFRVVVDRVTERMLEALRLLQQKHQEELIIVRHPSGDGLYNSKVSIIFRARDDGCYNLVLIIAVFKLVEIGYEASLNIMPDGRSAFEVVPRDELPDDDELRLLLGELQEGYIGSDVPLYDGDELRPDES